MKVSKSLQGMLQKARKSAEYKAQRITIKFSEDVHAVMEFEGMSQAALAKKLNIKPPTLSNALKPDGHNMTITSMARIANALNGDLVCYIKHEVFDKEKPAAVSVARPEVRTIEYDVPNYQFIPYPAQVAACASYRSGSGESSTFTQTKTVVTTERVSYASCAP